jgi:serine phosphatase RsbU (regulator of sigma subunit)
MIKSYFKSTILILLLCLWTATGKAQDDSLVYYFNHFSEAEEDKAAHLLKRVHAKDSTRIASIATRISSKENRFHFYDKLAERFYDSDDYETARMYYVRALYVAKLALNKKLIASAFANIGDMYRLQDSNTQALRNLLQSMYLYKEIGDQERVAHTMSLIGDIHRCIQQYDDALKYLNEALEISLKNNYVKDQTFCYSSLGGTYQSLEQYDRAFEYYSKGLSLAGIKDTMRSVDFLYSIGDLLVETGKTREAMDYLQRGAQLAELSNDQYHIAFCHLGIGEAHLAEGNIDGAIAEAMICYNLGVSMKAVGFCTEAADVLYRAYAKKDDYKNAFRFLKLLKDDSDSTMNMQHVKQQAAMELTFRNSFKEKQDSLLRAAEQLQRDTEHASELDRQKMVTAVGIAGLLVALIVTIMVYRNYKKAKHSSEIINKQKALVDTKNKEILDSINYARKIQQAIIPSNAEIRNVFPESFVLLLPKDIVSGDFYWVVKSGQQAFFAVADCTGHGVPGGFMSMLGTALLNEIINEKKIYEPADILDMLKLKIVMALRQTENTNENRDGMDIALFRLDLNLHELTFAGANNSLYVLRDSDLMELKGVKAPVGYSEAGFSQFSQQKMQLRSGDMLYMFTDGYPDQFGGEQGKKFKYKQLEQLLVQIGHLRVEEQRDVLLHTLEDWQGSLEQVDDICIAGIRI